MPFKPDPPLPNLKSAKDKQIQIRQPSKFVQGQFTESDYESDLEGSRIPPRWQPSGSDAEENSAGYKKVRVPLKLQSGKQKKNEEENPPSPPSKFDPHPPQFDGPPRPVFRKPSPPPAVIPPANIPAVTGTETVQRVQMEESTRFSKRFVTGKLKNKVWILFSFH